MQKLILLIFFSVFLYFPTKAYQPFIPGFIADSVTSISNPDQSYAVFLPEDYSDTKIHPIVFIMDPRGGALLPLKRFKSAADSLNYILISSYNTQSDTDQSVTIQALNTMINDAFHLFSIDTTRFYLAGFSGTARLSWVFGYEIKKYIAGIIGVGAGNNNGFSLIDSVSTHGIPFNYYGASGFYDFNYFELLELDPTLTGLKFPHQISFFEGTHQWAGKDILEDALYWMELIEMKQGTIEVDSIFIANLFDDWKNRAQYYKKINDPYHLYLHLLSMHRTFSSFNFLDDFFINNELNILKSEVDIPQLISEINLSISGFYTYAKLVQDLFHLYFISDTRLTFDKVNADLDISFLIEQKEIEQDIYRLRSINVFLELVYTQSGFYQTRLYTQKEDYENALVMLKIAKSIKPFNPYLCLQIVRISSKLKNWDEGVQNLKCIESEPWFEEFLEGDNSIEGLKKSKPYRKYIENKNDS